MGTAMLKDRTAEALRKRADRLKLEALRAEDSCVQERMREHAADIERLASVVTPVLSADEPREAH